ncbi:hypothetical protein [Tenacibaculum aquimarinum]|uniref:hypothetical protein n=1 Tax=Tenacibaculum aquimarinum TaxID=2910675 RepID=UPI001F0A1A25|nr:hypothetical protein [Tenacibaculum aquimarinum]MCH3885929.1 hypothetical protein [Tenacibaculum aquimarinum]
MNTKNAITFNFQSIEQQLKVQTNFLEVSEHFETDYGFFCRYLHILPFFKTPEDAFLCVNIQYFKTYKEFRFNSYNSFKEMVNGLPDDE